MLPGINSTPEPAEPDYDEQQDDGIAGAEFVLVDGRQVPIAEVKEALRVKEQDYLNLQRKFNSRDEEVAGLRKQVEALQGLMEAPEGTPDIDYSALYPPTVGPEQAGYYPQAQPPIGQAIDPRQVAQMAAMHAEQRLGARLQAVQAEIEGMKRQSQELARYERQFSDLESRHPEVTRETKQAVTDLMVEALKEREEVLTAESAYAILRQRQVEAAAQADAEKKRRRSSVSEPSTGRPVDLRKPRQSWTQGDWDEDLRRKVGRDQDSQI